VKSEGQSKPEPVGEIETALLDAELFVKYGAPERAIKRLRTALERSPRSIPLRERLREVAATHRHLEESARQCLALASLYIERDDFDTAYDRLLEAKQLDPRINIAAGLEAIRRARRPDLRPTAEEDQHQTKIPHATLAGDLSAISVFDAIQVIENAKLTGMLTLLTHAQSGQLMFNDGAIVDADCAGEKGEVGFRRIIEITSGSFEFQRSGGAFPATIQAASNTNLILDSLRHLDEAKQ
jgi:tetratricopeptide (TPR) repeat protein